MTIETTHLFRDVADRLLSEAILNGGCTIDPVTMGSPHSGYMVGGVVPSLVIEYGATLYRDDVAEWLADNWAPGEYVGSWWEDDGYTGRIHIDIVTHVRDREFAIALGQRRNELAIYDVTNSNTVYV